MSQLLSAWQDFPSKPQIATAPDALFSTVTVTASGSYFIKADNDAAVQTAWLIGDRDILTYGFKVSPTGHRGASLIIHVGLQAEINPASNVDVWKVFLLKATGTGTSGAGLQWMTGLKLPHLYVYFELLPAANSVTVNGFLKLEAGN